MSYFDSALQTDKDKWMARFRRFLRWITTPHVILSFIMLLTMIYLVIIPLYRMLMTTITVSDSDLRMIKDGVVGEFTWFHWVRMLTSKIAKLMTYEPLLHSLTISFGATGLALVIGGLMAWMVVRTDMPGRNIIHTLATIPYIMPSWTIAMAWTVMFKTTAKSGGTPGVLEFLTGDTTATIGWHTVQSPSSSAAGCITTLSSSFLSRQPCSPSIPRLKKPGNWLVQDAGASCARSPSHWSCLPWPRVSS